MKVDKAIMDGYEIDLRVDEHSAKIWLLNDSNGKSIAVIKALYNTEKTGYSMRSGVTYVRTGAVEEWRINFTFEEMNTGLIELITARHPQPHFKTVRSAFKWAVVVIEEYLLANAKEEEE